MPSASSKQSTTRRPRALVGIGASAGGLEAMTALLSALPADTGLAFLFMQHLPPGHAGALAEILARSTKMSVLPLADSHRIEATRCTCCRRSARSSSAATR